MNKFVESLITTRSITEADEAFVYSTWLQGYFHGNAITSLSKIGEKEFSQNYRKIIKEILARSNTYTVLVCLKEDDDVIISYAVLERKDGNTILHWAFTKPAFRKFGIMGSILPNDITTVTHMTTLGIRLKPQEWEYKPFESNNKEQ